MIIKRTAVINDISCVGKCSLTVTIPILSSIGIEVCPLPTAVLSTHTEFPNPTFRDLSDDIVEIVKHWHSLNVKFDTVYSGYLAGKEQIDQVISIMKSMSSAKIRLVDPIMGDNGKLYSKFSADFPQHMLRLCQCADIIVPNVTEACAMCSIPYHDGIYTCSEIELLINELRRHMNAQIVLTGVHLYQNKVGVAIWDGSELLFYNNERVEGHFPGTGDIFASVLLGALMNDKTLYDSAVCAAQFTASCILNTLRYPREGRFGVMFEECLPSLYSIIGL